MKDFESGFTYLHKVARENELCGDGTTDDQLTEVLAGLIKYAGGKYGETLAKEQDVPSSHKEPEGDTSQDD